MSQQNDKIEEKVMEEIKSGKVKLRSRYVFLAEKLGLGSAFIFSAFLAVLFFTLTLFYLKASDNLIYLSFGSRGLFAFLETFPYLLVISLIICIFIAGFILKKSDFVYKESFGRLSGILLVFIVLFGVILTFTSLGENIEKRSYNHQAPERFFRPFLRQEFIDRQRGIAGKVMEVDSNFINVQTPFGIKKIDITKVASSTLAQIKIDSFIVAVGEKRGDVFFANNLRLVNEEDMPMVRRGVNDRFGPPKEVKIPFDPKIKECLDNCRLEKNITKECFDNCFLK